jgi:IclR family acetate operon transcriptional repressor
MGRSDGSLVTGYAKSISRMRTPSSSTKRGTPKPRSGPQSVGRIFAILDSIAGSRRSASLSELAKATGAPKTSLVGLLAGMTAEGCLVRDDAGRYAVGPRVHSLAMRAMAGKELVSLVRPILANLSEATGETTVLGALAPDADAVTYLARIESDNPIRYAVTVGQRRDLYSTATGKALLAYFEPERLKQYLNTTPRKRHTGTTITSAADLLTVLSRIRRDGVARNNDERVVGASGMAAPIFASDGSVVAALLIAGPSERMRVNAKNNEKLLRLAAAECTRLLGGTPGVAEARD